MSKATQGKKIAGKAARRAKRKLPTHSEPEPVEVAPEPVAEPEEPVTDGPSTSE